MKNTITLLAMMLLATIVVAQEEDPKVIQTKRVRIEIKNVNGKMDTVVTEEISTTKEKEEIKIQLDSEDGVKVKRIITVEGDEDAVLEDVEEVEEIEVEKVEVDDIDEDIEKEIVIIKEFEDEEIVEKRSPKFVETNFFVMDWGLNNWVSNNAVDVPTPYEDMKLENVSANFHLGIVQQGVNLIKGHLRFVYGIGIEYNNYRFKEGVTITPDSKPIEYEVDDVLNYKKNKIVSRYATVPLMLNFKSNPGDDDNSFKIAAGIQAGYLIGSHQKQKWGEGNKKEKKKVRGDYGFEDYRLGYVAQFGYGDFVIYGKYYPTNTFKSGRGPIVNTACVGLVLTPF